jgi:hypothetical protein
MTIILSNQSIMRMLYYQTDSPLEESTVDRNGQIVEQSDITPDMITNKNIIMLQPFYNTTILSDSTIKVFINPYKGNLKDFNFNSNIFTCDIAIPNTFWVLQGNGQIRAIQIAQFLTEQVDNQILNGGLGRVFVIEYKVSKINDTYSCMTLFLKVDSSAKESAKENG